MSDHILEPEVSLDHLSASSIRMYLRCPRQWWYRYVLGIKIAPDGGLVSGIAFHNAAEACLVYKIETGENAPANEAEERARDNAVRGLDDAILAEDQSPGAVVDKAVRLTSAWAKEALPEAKPASVEEGWELQIDNVTVVGRIDMVSTDGHVVDWKTTSKAPPKPQALAANPQTGLYSAATGAETVEYVHVVDSKSKGPYIAPVEVPAPLVKQSRELSQELVVDVAGACQSGHFPRNTEGWHCSARWCGYYSRCMSGKEKP